MTCDIDALVLAMVMELVQSSPEVEKLTYRMPGKLNNRIIIEKILITKTILDPT